MNTFKEFYTETSPHRSTALLPGGFKPPTRGHFNALQYMLDNAEDGIVFIGKKERNGITAEMSKQIWDIYAKYCKRPITVVIADVSPVRSVYEYVDANIDKAVIVGAGSKEEDVKRFEYFEKHVDKYPLVHILTIPMQSQGVSGSETRRLIASNIDDALEYFIPDELNETDRDLVKNILLSV
tara:strand:- start:1644 stop:2189 length:546 start_codon:yes stop_codon:yes gene_type:complete